MVDCLSGAGFRRIEAAFVSPKWVTAMADGAAVMAGIAGSGRALPPLTPNLKGFEELWRQVWMSGNIRLGFRRGFSQTQPEHDD
jgi:hypothetical protein